MKTIAIFIKFFEEKLMPCVKVEFNLKEFLTAKPKKIARTTALKESLKEMNSAIAAIEKHNSNPGICLLIIFSHFPDYK